MTSWLASVTQSKVSVTMKTLTIEKYTELKANHRSKVGVADKLKSFLDGHISTMKKSEAYEIEAKDFLGIEAKDFHYYTALKMLQANYADKLDWDFTIKENGRSESIRIKVK